MEENRKILIAALVIILGGNAGSIVGSLNSDVRHDAFTGSDGAELEDRIEFNELDIAACKDRNARHREDQAQELATIRAKTLSNEYLIKQCMRITGQ